MKGCLSGPKEMKGVAVPVVVTTEVVEVVADVEQGPGSATTVSRRRDVMPLNVPTQGWKEPLPTLLVAPKPQHQHQPRHQTW